MMVEMVWDSLRWFEILIIQCCDRIVCSESGTGCRPQDGSKPEVMQNRPKGSNITSFVVYRCLPLLSRSEKYDAAVSGVQVLACHAQENIRTSRLDSKGRFPTFRSTTWPMEYSAVVFGVCFPLPPLSNGFFPRLIEVSGASLWVATWR